MLPQPADLEAEPIVQCPQHKTLIIRTSGCASMWRFGKKLASDSGLSAVRCKGCPIGARNAGVNVDEVQLTLVRRCVRCGRTASKIVHDMHCVSCYNREREFLRGKRSRFPALSKTARLHSFSILLLSGGEIRVTSAERVFDGSEGLMRLAGAAPAGSLIVPNMRGLLAIG